MKLVTLKCNFLRSLDRNWVTGIMTGIISFFYDCMHYITKKKKKGSSLSLVNKWKKTIFTLKKIIISCVSYRKLHVKQPDVASGVRPETSGHLVDKNVSKLYNGT